MAVRSHHLMIPLVLVVVAGVVISLVVPGQTLHATGVAHVEEFVAFCAFEVMFRDLSIFFWSSLVAPFRDRLWSPHFVCGLNGEDKTNYYHRSLKGKHFFQFRNAFLIVQQQIQLNFLSPQISNPITHYLLPNFQPLGTPAQPSKTVKNETKVTTQN